MNDDIKLFDLLLHIPNYLPKKDCQLLMNYYDSVKNTAQYEASTTPKGEFKQSSFECIELTNPNSLELNILRYSVHDIIKKYIKYLKSFDSFHEYSLEHGSFNYAHKYRILKYRTGSSIHPHSDHGPYGYGSCTINLNEDYEGGEFTFFNGRHKIKLKQGDAIIFPADFFWVHEVKPITLGERYTFNCFLNKIPFEVLRSLNFLSNSININPSDPFYVGLELDKGPNQLENMRTTSSSTEFYYK
jgi:hypothetical protein